MKQFDIRITRAPAMFTFSTLRTKTVDRLKSQLLKGKIPSIDSNGKFRYLCA